MKYLALYSFVCCNLCFAQIDMLNSQTSQNISVSEVSDSLIYFTTYSAGYRVFNKNSLQLSFFNSPLYDDGYNVGFQEFGDSLFYASSIYGGYPYKFTLSRSADFGQSWQILLDTISNTDLGGIIVWDSTHISLLATIQSSWTTSNGGVSWMQTPGIWDGTRKKFADSIVILGSFDGNIAHTTDFGHHWNYSYLHNVPMADIAIVSIDTTYILQQDNTLSHCFSDTLNDNCWITKSESVVAALSLCVVSKSEIYVGGHDGNGHQRIARTTDLGDSWEIFDPGIPGEIYSITLIKDSLFLIAGQSGFLYIWNKNQTQWGMLGLGEMDQQNLKISPNPSNGIFTIDSEQPIEAISLTDFAGRNVRFDYNPQTQELNVNESKGVYFLELRQSGKTVVRKLVLE